ncbi:MAG: thioredoxin family protein, partial [Bacteroidota bacterium]
PLPARAGNGLTLVLMTSHWDGNGIILRSIIQRMTDQYRGVRFCEADYEQAPRLARLFNLTSPPGLLFIREGELVHRITKPISAGRISDLIQAAA